MEFAEIPRPSLNGGEDINRRNPLFYAGTKEPPIPTFTGYGDNITGDFLRPSRQADGVLTLPRYTPKYAMSGLHISDDTEVYGSTIETIKKANRNGMILESPIDETGSLYLVDPPDDTMIMQQTDVARLQERMPVHHHRHHGNSSNCYSCCYSPAVLIFRTVPRCCCPVTPWLKRIVCIGFLIVVNVFLMLLVLAIGLELGLDGFSGKGNANGFWGTNNLLNNFPCQSNSTDCLAKSCATGSRWRSNHQDYTVVILGIAGLLAAFFSASRT